MNKVTSEEYLSALEDADQYGNDESTARDEGDQEESVEIRELIEKADRPKLQIHQYRPHKPMTPAMQAFAQGVIEGKSLRQSYRDAYPNALGSDQSISASAARLSKDPRVVAMVREAWEQTQEALADDMAATKRYVMRQLVDLSKGANQEGSRLKALELLGRAAGLWREQQSQQEKPLTAAELKAQLAGHLRLVQASKTKVAGE